MKILISDPEYDWTERVAGILTVKGHQVDIAIDGRDCQRKLYKNQYDAVVLDLTTHSHSGLEVLKFLRTNHPKLNSIITIPSDEKLRELGLDEGTKKKLGLSQLIVKPISMDKLFGKLEGNEYSSWKYASSDPKEPVEIEVVEADKNFSKVNIDDFPLGLSPVDLYLQLGQEKYVRFLKMGDMLEEEKFQLLKDEKKVTHIFIRTESRPIFINFLNDRLKSNIEEKANNENTLRNINLTRLLVGKFVDETCVGIDPKLVNEAVKICQSMLDLLNKDPNVSELLREMKDIDANFHNHVFLTGMFSVFIARNMEWSSERTTTITAMGGLIHDIGLLRIPAEIRSMQYSDMNASQKKIYESHVDLGLDLLNKCASIPEPVKQIVYQHHETIDGLGYPNKLSAQKIYPMAKIVGLADEFAHLIVTEKITPFEGLKRLATDRSFIQRYDPLIIKGLFAGFIKKSNKVA